MNNLDAPSKDGDLISRTTILILSGVLLSLSAVPDLDGFEFCVFAGGMVGLISFLALDLVADQRAKMEHNPSRLVAEQRLTRHLTATAPLSAEAAMEQHALLDWLHRETRDLN